MDNSEISNEELDDIFKFFDAKQKSTQVNKEIIDIVPGSIDKNNESHKVSQEDP